MLPLSAQTGILNADVLTAAYAVVWLSQAMPAFSTTELALKPFHTMPGNDVSDSTISLLTTAYFTELDCTAPSKTLSERGSVSFDNGHGCFAQDMIYYPDILDSRHFSTQYIGYFDDPRTDRSLEAGGCPLTSSHTFLAIWKRASKYQPDFNDDFNATALFCTPSYYSQAVNATVAAGSHAVISTTPVAERSLLTDGTFNITLFERLLAVGAPDLVDGQDVSAISVVRQDSRLQNMSVATPLTNMVGFAVGSTKWAPEAYLDHKNLSLAYQKAHKLLFSLAMQAVLNNTEHDATIYGTQATILQGITIVPLFAILSQGFLLIVAACAAFMLWSLRKRPSKLTDDPDSIANIMFLARNQSLRTNFTATLSNSKDYLKDRIGDAHFRFERDRTLSCSCISLKNPLSDHVLIGDNDERAQTASVNTAKPLQPREFSKVVGGAVVVSLCCILAAIVFLQTKATSSNGLALPSESVLVQQIILNVIPTVVATLLEPYWVLLNRLSCMIRPLEELRRGNASARKSLLLKYTSLPPQLIVWRALKARHWLLASLSCTALLANVLTLGLSGLFSVRLITHGSDISLLQIYSPYLSEQGLSRFDKQSTYMYGQADPLYVATANFTKGTSLPAWTTPHHYFPPMDLGTSGSPNGSTIYTTQATGFGAVLQCSDLNSANSNDTVAFSFDSDATNMSLVTSHRQPDTSIIQCKPYSWFLGADGDTKDKRGTFAKLDGDPAVSKALEVSNLMLPLEDDSVGAEEHFCSGLLVKGWIRANTTLGSNNTVQDTTATSTFISCKPVLRSALFSISVLPSGHILHSSQLSNFTYNPPDANLSLAMTAITTSLGGTTSPTWHNHTVAVDWTSDMIKKLTGTALFQDPAAAVPTFQTASSTLGDLYSRLFAIQMSLLSPQLLPLPTPQNHPATLTTPQRRIFLSQPLYLVTTTILTINIAVCIVFYSTRPTPFLPRLPASIASQITYFAASGVVDDICADLNMHNGEAGIKEHLRALDEHGWRYAYGKFVGRDGKVHVGMERVPFVQPLPPSRLEWSRWSGRAGGC